MIVSQTPLRVSFVGGGTDLREYYERRDTAGVISTAIDKYIYITVNKKFDHKIRASYSVTEMVDSVDELQHELIRAALTMVELDGGIEITSISDIPSQGTGLGSSSSYVVGLLNALYAYMGRHVGAERLAREACQIEIARCGKPIGKQDQYIAALGGIRDIRFGPGDEVVAQELGLSAADRRALQQQIMLFYTGVTRSADSILVKQRAVNLVYAHTLGGSPPHALVSELQDLANRAQSSYARLISAARPIVARRADETTRHTEDHTEPLQDFAGHVRTSAP